MLSLAYGDLPPQAGQLIKSAYAAIFRKLNRHPGPYTLTGQSTHGGVICIDPSPNPAFSMPRFGPWIWSSSQAFFRFRVIESRKKLDMWDFGVGHGPVGLPVWDAGTTAPRPTVTHLVRGPILGELANWS